MSIAGVNPTALTGQLELAYKAILAKSFGHAAKILATVRSGRISRPEDVAAADAMMAFVNERFEQELAGLDAMEQRKDYYALHAAFLALKKTYAPLDDFKERTKRYEDALAQPEWKAEIRLGGRYAQMIATLKRSRSKAALAGLERFAEENPKSLYGTWAATVVRKFRDDDVVVDPSSEEPASSAPSTIPAWAPAE